MQKIILILSLFGFTGCTTMTGVLSDSLPVSKSELKEVKKSIIDVRDEARSTMTQHKSESSADLMQVKNDSFTALSQYKAEASAVNKAQWEQISKLIWALTGVGSFGGGYAIRAVAGGRKKKEET